jgi:hypothetical protein
MVGPTSAPLYERRRTLSAPMALSPYCTTSSMESSRPLGASVAGAGAAAEGGVSVVTAAGVAQAARSNSGKGDARCFMGPPVQGRAARL